MIRVVVDPFPSSSDIEALWLAGWGSSAGDYCTKVLPRSLAHVGGFDGARLIGLVNVAWDGGIHAFILDTVVHPDFRRRGIARELVCRAAEVARDRGARWLHVDFEPRLEGFYRSCGFRRTEAGIIELA